MKKMTGKEAMRIAHEQYGEAMPRTVTGDWLRGRIRGGLSDLNEMARIVNRIEEDGGGRVPLEFSFMKKGGR